MRPRADEWPCWVAPRAGRCGPGFQGIGWQPARARHQDEGAPVHASQHADAQLLLGQRRVRRGRQRGALAPGRSHCGTLPALQDVKSCVKLGPMPSHELQQVTLARISWYRRHGLRAQLPNLLDNASGRTFIFAMACTSPAAPSPLQRHPCCPSAIKWLFIHPKHPVLLQAPNFPPGLPVSALRPPVSADRLISSPSSPMTRRCATSTTSMGSATESNSSL